MAERHKWADVIIAWANGEMIEIKPPGSDVFVDWDAFFTSCQSPIWYDDLEYRIKPRTITIGDIKVPEPLREEPAMMEKYFFPSPYKEALFDWNRWEGDRFDLMCLQRFLVHPTKEAAIAHAKALIAVSGGTV